MSRSMLCSVIAVIAGVAALLASCVTRETIEGARDLPDRDSQKTPLSEQEAEERDIFGSVEWPVVQGNSRRTGQTGDTGPGDAYDVAWVADLGDHTIVSSATSPVFGGGLIFTTFKKQGVFAIRPETGEIVWRFPLGTYSNFSPGYRDGVVYVGADRPEVLALDAATGHSLWAIRMENPHPAGPNTWANRVHVTGSPVFHGSLMILGGSYGASGKSPGFVCALDVESRQIAWKTEMAGKAIRGCATDGQRVYVSSTDGCLKCLDISDGRLHWQEKGLGYNMSVPVVIGDTVCFGTYSRTLQRRRAADGAALWNRMLGSYFSHGFATDGKCLFLGGGPGIGICAVAVENGATLWRLDTSPARHSCSPTLAGPHVYIGGSDKKLRCIDAATGNLRWEFETGGQIGASPLVIGKWVFVQSSDGYMHALRAAESAQHPRSTDAASR